ncbi:TolB family protein [Paenibacillus sp. YAF4_2]|uniref:TolB family protein n=1 Tax=Paenibacillus sp. YAF4_2 TaxID=3233085 RepID=UPI003F96AC5F
MKKAVVISVLATALGAVAVTPVMAQSATQSAQAVQIGSTTISINGTAVAIRTIDASGVTLASVRDLAKALEASLNVAGSTITVQLNHNVVSLNDAVTVNGTAFVEPVSFLSKLGVGYSQGNITTIKLLQDVDQVTWVNASKLIVSKSGDTGREDYLVDAATGKNELLLTSSDTSELIVSPDGSKAAYSEEDGTVNIIDLSTKQSTKVSTDTSIKNEMLFSADGSSIFFFQGDKNSVICKLTLADGSVTKILEDKVDYKANLSVSADGTKVAYFQIKQPVVKNDATDVSKDDVTIDPTGTETQAYFYDSAKGDNKPVQLTTDKNDKAFLELSADGSKAYFVSINDDAVGSVASVDTASIEAASVYSAEDVYQLNQAGGKLVLLTAKGDANSISALDPATGTASKLYSVSDGVSELIVSGNGDIAAISDGQVAVPVNGKFTTITR